MTEIGRKTEGKGEGEMRWPSQVAILLVQPELRLAVGRGFVRIFDIILQVERPASVPSR